MTKLAVSRRLTEAMFVSVSVRESVVGYNSADLRQHL